MATTTGITRVRLAEVLTGLGMIGAERARSVLAESAEYAGEPMETLHEVACELESFGVAVAIHSEDVDCADSHYEWLLEEAAALTGGSVTVSDYRFERSDPDDEESGPGTMHFRRNGQLLSFGVEQESNDYLDMGAAQQAVEALWSPDEPREFRCVVQEQADLDDDIMVLATAEQREGLRRELGLNFQAALGRG